MVNRTPKIPFLDGEISPGPPSFKGYLSRVGTWIFGDGPSQSPEVTYTFGYSFVAVLQFTIYLYCAELFPTAVRTLGVGVSFFGGFGI